MKKRTTKKRIYLNSEETLLVISPFAHDMLFDSQKALKKLAKKQQILVLAEHYGKRQRHSEQKNLIIERIWEKNKPLSLFRLVPYIVKNDKITHILVQFHFKIFGKKLTNNLVLPLILFWLKLSKKRVYFEFHQVLGEKNIRKNTPWKAVFERTLFNLFLGYFYKSIANLTNNIILFKPSLQKKLSQFIPEEQIILLPATLVRTDHKQEKKLDKTLNFYKRLVSTPYDIAPTVRLNLSK